MNRILALALISWATYALAAPGDWQFFQSASDAAGARLDAAYWQDVNSNRLYVLSGDPAVDSFGYFDLTTPSNPVWTLISSGSQTWSGNAGDLAQSSSFPGIRGSAFSTVVDTVTNSSDMRLWLFGTLNRRGKT
jgi:hypothetical protein